MIFHPIIHSQLQTSPNASCNTNDVQTCHPEIAHPWTQRCCCCQLRNKKSKKRGPRLSSNDVPKKNANPRRCECISGNILDELIFGEFGEILRVPHTAPAQCRASLHAQCFCPVKRSGTRDHVGCCGEKPTRTFSSSTSPETIAPHATHSHGRERPPWNVCVFGVAATAVVFAVIDIGRLHCTGQAVP